MKVATFMIKFHYTLYKPYRFLSDRLSICCFSQGIGSYLDKLNSVLTVCVMLYLFALC